MKKINYLTSCLLVFIAGYYIHEASKLINVDRKDVGPGFYPHLIAGIMILLAVLLLIQTIRSPAASRNEASSFQPGKLKPYAAMLSLILYIFLMNRLGFISTSIVFMLLLTCLFFGKDFRHHLLSSVCIAIGVSVGIWVLFHNLLKVPLPGGILF